MFVTPPYELLAVSDQVLVLDLVMESAAPVPWLMPPVIMLPVLVPSRMSVFGWLLVVTGPIETLAVVGIRVRLARVGFVFPDVSVKELKLIDALPLVTFVPAEKVTLPPP